MDVAVMINAPITGSERYLELHQATQVCMQGALVNICKEKQCTMRCQIPGMSVP